MDLVGKEINNCYRIIEKIGDNSICDVYKMEGLFSPIEVVIKIFKKKNNDYLKEELLRFKQKALGIYNINHPNIIKVFEIDEFDGYSYQIMEYFEGLTIKEHLNNGVKFSFEEILKIIIGICRGLEVAHRNGAIHKNLNLHNILLPNDKNFFEAKITNFGFADLIFAYEEYDDKFVNNVLGFLPPEACNIFNKKTDERSDLFSLGVIFYFLLTDKMPFESKNIDEYFRSVIAINPISPSKIFKFNIPEIIDRIILKLLNREKKERYQTAESLLDDLERIQRRENEFDPGSEDLSFNTNFETDLINREKELVTLQDLYNKVKETNYEVCLINGSKGMGKSKLLMNFGEYVFRNEGVYIEVNCNPISNKKPFYIFNEYLYYYFDYINKFEKVKKSKIIDKIYNEIKNDFGIISNQFKFILKIFNNTNKDVTNKNDYLEIFGNFFCSLLNNEYNTVFVVKNIQWIDKDSLMLLNKINSMIAKKSLLLIFTCFDYDMGKNNLILNLFKDKSIVGINLDKLNIDYIKELLLNILGKKNINIPEKIIDFIYQKSEGNPFFAIEILRQLINYEIIFPVMEVWQSDILKLGKIKWKNKEEVLLSKIQQLRNYELTVLTYSVILGIEFQIDSLLKICSIDKNDIITAIDYLVDQDILRIITTKDGNKYFVNEIILPVLYNKLENKKRKEIHHEIAEKLEEDFVLNNNKENLYLIAYHYEKSDFFDKTIDYCHKTALYYIDTNGYFEASNYLDKASIILEQNNKKESKEWHEINNVKKDVLKYSS